MKNIYNKISGLFLTGILLFTSCEPNLDINRDPDLLAPDQIPIIAQVPTVITGVGASMGSYFAIVGGFWSQHWTQSAVANQYKQIDDYSITASDGIINGGWRSLYDALTDIRSVKAKALAINDWNYYLIATTMEVYASQLLVDSYGEIPYADANNPDVLTPTFSSGEEVYDLMVEDLLDALSKDLTEVETVVELEAADLVFGADMEQWTRFANTLLLRLHMRQTEARPSVAGNIANILNADFLEMDAKIDSDKFSDEASKRNPLYESDRAQLNVKTNMRASAALHGFLSSNTDPRLLLYYGEGPAKIQGDYNNGNDADATVILAYNDPVYFISAAESYFLQAEAHVRYGDPGTAETMYNMGVQAAFDRWDLDATDLLANEYAFPNGTDEEKIEAIIVQKWANSFPGNTMESFFEQNRTGFPRISSVPADDPTYQAGQYTYSVEGKTGGLFPKRFVHSQNERQRNVNAPAATSTTDPVWYDVN